MILSIIQNGSIVAGGNLGLDFAHLHVDEIAPDPEMACLVIRERNTFLRFIFWVYSVLVLQLVGAMGELAFIFVRALPMFHELPTQFRFLFVRFLAGMLLGGVRFRLLSGD